MIVSSQYRRGLLARDRFRVIGAYGSAVNVYPGGKVDPAARHLAAAALEHTPVTMRSPQIRPLRAQSVPGPTGVGARGASGRVAGGSIGYGSAAGPAPDIPRGGHVQGPAVAHTSAPPQSPITQQRQTARSGGRWPGIPADIPQRAAPMQRVQTVDRHPQPTAHRLGPASPASSHRAPPPPSRAAPQMAHLPGGGGHGPGGGGRAESAPGPGGGHGGGAGGGGGKEGHGGGDHGGGGHGDKHHD